MAEESAGAYPDLSGIVLAAGQSARMGIPKALLPVAGRTFLAAVTTALLDGGAPRVVVVLGHRASDIVQAVPQDSRVSVVVNPRPEAGQLSSLQSGLRAAGPRLAAAVVTLVDVPLAGPAVVRSLLAEWRRTGAPLVRPVREGRHGHPVVFAAEVLAALRDADPQLGARPVLARFAARSVDIATEDPGPFVDIDTRLDYERHVGPWPER